jgi:hypothetical protein
MTALRLLALALLLTLSACGGSSHCPNPALIWECAT